MLANDTDPENNSLTASVTTQPTHGTLDFNSNGTFTYTPTQGYTGTDTFKYKASDGTATSDPVTVTITVDSVNDAPTLNAISNPAAISEDASTQTVNLSGITAGGNETQNLQVTATSSNTALIPTPTVVYTSPNATGSLTFTPVANQSGTAEITVTVRDAGLDGVAGNGDDGTVSKTFTVTVNAVNDCADPGRDCQSRGDQRGRGRSRPSTWRASRPAQVRRRPCRVTATSDNTALIPNPTVIYTSPNATGSLTYHAGGQPERHGPRHRHGARRRPGRHRWATPTTRRSRGPSR